MAQKQLDTSISKELLAILKTRFEQNTNRHPDTNWVAVQQKLDEQPHKMWSLNEMEITGGEPDIIGYNEENQQFIFADCAAESPAGRRNLCYDRKALEARKEHKPANTAIDVALAMGIELMDEAMYRHLQSLGNFDTKTSSWLKTPDAIRNHGGAIFGDYRYGHVFIYHNGAQSYYSARGFRGILQV